MGLATNPPPNIVSYFTDGSAIPNPGPSGAGIWITTSAFNGAPSEAFISASLGHGDNNLGEMSAILIALFVTRAIMRCFPDIAHAFFSDSLGCICYLSGKWPSPTDIVLARSTRKLYRKVNPSPPLYWIRGHSNIVGNEHADQSAKVGTSLNNQGDTINVRIKLDNFPTCIANEVNSNRITALLKKALERHLM